MGVKGAGATVQNTVGDPRVLCGPGVGSDQNHFGFGVVKVVFADEVLNVAVAVDIIAAVTEDDHQSVFIGMAEKTHLFAVVQVGDDKFAAVAQLDLKVQGRRL